MYRIFSTECFLLSAILFCDFGHIETSLVTTVATVSLLDATHSQPSVIADAGKIVVERRVDVQKKAGDDLTSPTDSAELEDICAKLMPGCVCRRGTAVIVCNGVAPLDLSPEFLEVVASVEAAEFHDCKQPFLNLDFFTNLTSLRSLAVRNCGVREVFGAQEGGQLRLRQIDLHGNALTNWSSVVSGLQMAPYVSSLDVSSNYLTSLSDDLRLSRRLRLLNVSFNEISVVDSVPNVEILDLSSNRFRSLNIIDWPPSLVHLNLSSNPALVSMAPVKSPLLRSVNLNGCALRDIPITHSMTLRTLLMRNSSLEVLNFERFDAPILEELDLSGSVWLSAVVGQLSKSVETFSLTDSLLTYFPITFFQRARKLRMVNLGGNPFACERCFIGWRFLLPSSMQPTMNCTIPLHKDCSIGTAIPTDSRRIVRARVSESAVLSCEAFGNPTPRVEWSLVRPERQIGYYDAPSRRIVMNWTRDGAYRIIDGGNLIISGARHELVERYRCVATNSKGNASAIVRFRLDFSDWYSLSLLRSVFWGSVVSSLVVCAVSFVFNLLWIASRKMVLWWIHRAERLSRVRSMVEAVEKYRQRQMVNLQEGYHKSVGHIRENYHQQVHQLRSSYASQAERFRGYRVAQMESMNQHLDNLRDNYNQQMCRMRDFGSRRVEQLWESYERQVNRVRTFSLQQRLRLMRQYKVKQRYLNKLLEKFSDDPNNGACVPPHSEATVLGTLQEWEEEGPLSRSSSYYSLPEYVLDDTGEVHCPPNRADMASRSFSRHHQPPSIAAARSAAFHDNAQPLLSEDGPSTSKGFSRQSKKLRGNSTASMVVEPSYGRRRHSLIDQADGGAAAAAFELPDGGDDDTPSTSKLDDETSRFL